MTDRRFGVEIECGLEGYNRYHQNYYGIQREVVQKLGEAGLPAWEDIGFDGTLIEVRSPILQGKDGFFQLKQAMETLKDMGGYTTANDGLHIHHDAPEFIGDKQLIVRLVKSWAENQNHIDRLVAPNRIDHGHCPPFSTRDITRLENMFSDKTCPFECYDCEDYYEEELDGGERGALNVGALTHHGTIEIRQHEGTLEYDVAESWIRFGQYFIESCLKRKRPITRCADVDTFLKRAKVAKKPSEILKAKNGV